MSILFKLISATYILTKFKDQRIFAELMKVYTVKERVNDWKDAFSNEILSGDLSKAMKVVDTQSIPQSFLE